MCGNVDNAALLTTWRDAGKKVVLSFGGVSHYLVLACVFHLKEIDCFLLTIQYYFLLLQIRVLGWNGRQLGR